MTKPTEIDHKAELIAGLRDVRQRILTLVSTMKPAMREEVYLGTWSTREMLAHLAGWDETNIKAIDEIFGDELPSFYEYSGKDWATYNAMLVEKHSRDNHEDLISHVEQTHAKLLEKLEAVPADELWKDRGIRAKGWKVTIGRLLEAELQDEERHYAQLKAFIESDLKS